MARMISGKPFSPRKRFGQHFLHDKNIARQIVDSIDFESGNTLVEIGPGLGILTFPLLERTGMLHAIEIDRDLAEHIAGSTGSAGRLIVHREDALKFDFCKRIGGRLGIVGNLPYNISTPLLFHLLDHLPCIEQMVLMLQKEVANRICAAPGNREYGRLSVMVQSVCDVNIICRADAACFSPPPKVESAVINLTPRKNPAIRILDYRWLAELVRTAFSQRRKTIRNALKPYADEKALADAGISPSSRPEQIPVDTYIRLSNQIRSDLRSPAGLKDGGTL